jgi:hypothetical protein
MTDTSHLLKHIVKDDSGRLYYTISNADGKTWIIPDKNTQTALSLYQSSSWRGKLLKRLFPYLKGLKMLRKQLAIKDNRYELRAELSDLLTDVFHSDAIELAFFLGTPSVRQKIILQISRGKTILGYCKVSDREEVKQSFYHEQTILKTLKAKGVKQIPECLYCGALTDNISLFVQSTVKTNQSKVIHQWRPQHWDFLTELKQKTEQTLPFEQTDYFHTIDTFAQDLSCFSLSERSIIRSAIDKVMGYYSGKTVAFSACHDDFTPWNMCFERGQLFVFDLEYAKLTYPPYLDRFCFLTQCCIFEQHLDADEIYKVYLSQKQTISKRIENPDFSYLCSLLSILSLYSKEIKENPYIGARKNLQIWCSLIVNLL